MITKTKFCDNIFFGVSYERTTRPLRQPVSPGSNDDPFAQPFGSFVKLGMNFKTGLPYSKFRITVGSRVYAPSRSQLTTYESDIVAYNTSGTVQTKSLQFRPETSSPQVVEGDVLNIKIEAMNSAGGILDTESIEFVVPPKAYKNFWDVLNGTLWTRELKANVINCTGDIKANNTLVEYGQSGGARYWRWLGGNQVTGFQKLQIVEMTKTITGVSWKAWGNLLDAGPFDLGNYPKPFITKPAIVICPNGTTGCWLGSIKSNTANGTNIGSVYFSRTNTGNPTTIQVGIIAIGRW